MTVTKRHAWIVAGVILFAISAWISNRCVCSECAMQQVTLELPDHSKVRGRLYTPEHAKIAAGEREATRIPAVILVHGYLANGGMMEIPWVEELTRLDWATLVLDRRGAGRSDGTLWPRSNGSVAADAVEPDLQAAVLFLKSHLLVDSARIAIVGHSDGAGAAIAAASLDWGIRATVAMSASTAPSQFVNHVAPQNLLLLYGEEDDFVLRETDRVLMARGTRGVLEGPGDFGQIRDGSARRLVRVSGAGHISLLYAPATHREALAWLAESFAVTPDDPVSPAGDPPSKLVLRDIHAEPHRWWWVCAGCGALILILLAHPSTGPSPGGYQCRSSAAHVAVDTALLSGAWVAGLYAARPVAQLGGSVIPVEEGPVLVGLLLGIAAALSAGLAIRKIIAAVWVWPALIGTLHTPVRLKIAAALRGCAVAASLYIAAYLLLRHHYGVTFTPLRGVLLLLFATAGLPTFAVLECWLTGFEAHAPPARPAAQMLLLAGATTLLSGQLFERMSRAPGYLLALTLVVGALARVGGWSKGAASHVTLGAGTLGWMAAVAGGLY